VNAKEKLVGDAHRKRGRRATEVNVSDQQTALNQPMLNWVRSLPMRWAFGGFILGIVWVAASVLLQGGFSNPVGGLVAVVRVFAMFVLPLIFLGLVWGYTERFYLERSAEKSREQFDKAIQQSVWRQVGKAIVCGLAFRIYIHWVGYGPNGPKYAPWDNPENIIANTYSVLGFVLLAVPVGLVVGIVSRRSLLRRLTI
jgi:hypothetical protein